MTATGVQQFQELLQDWDGAVAEGGSALSSLQRVFGVLKPNSGTQDTPKILDRLMKLAPSFRLEAYISRLRHNTENPDPDAAAAMHAAYITLQNAVSAAKSCLHRMQAVAEQCADVALALPLEPAIEAGLSSLSMQEEAHAQQQPGEAAAAEQGVIAAEIAADATGANTPPAAAKAEEVALLLTAAASGLERDMAWMELAAHSITLDTTPDDIATFITLWGLQPFTDEALLAAIRDCAAAAAAAAAADG